MKRIIKNEEEMIEQGKNIAELLTGGDILCLYGDLGAGKTTLTKGIALGLGIKEDILSPTFTLMNIYNLKGKNLLHIDTYRLKDPRELVEIGVEDYLGDKNTITIIEWPEKIVPLLKDKKTINIYISHDEEKRILEIN